MNDFDTLRHDLRHEADQLADVGVPTRSTSVHSRIRGVRRRRRSAATGALVLVMAATGLGVAVHRDGRAEVASSTTTVLGQQVPGAVDVAGFPYELVDEVPVTIAGGDGTVDVDLGDRGGTSYAYSLVATGLGADGKATLVTQEMAWARVFGRDGFAFPIRLGQPPSDTQVSLENATPGARVALATYRRTTQLPAGVDDGTIVFRQQVAGRTLQRAVFAEPGATSIELPVDGSRFIYSYTCVSARDDLSLTVSLDGKPQGGTSCANPANIDPGAEFTLQTADAPGRHRLQVRLTHGDGTPADGGGVRFGLAVYDAGVTRQVLGVRVDDVVDWEGRTYRLDRVVNQQDVAAPLVERIVPSDEDVLVGCVVVVPTPGARAELILPSGQSCGGINSNGADTRADQRTVATTDNAGLILAGDSVDLVLDSANDPAWQGALLLYVPVD